MVIELRAARGDRPLRRRLLPGEIQIRGSAGRAFHFRSGSKLFLRRAVGSGADVEPLFRARARRLDWGCAPESGVAQNIAARFDSWIGNLLSDYQLVLVVERSGLREKLRRVDSSLYGRFARIQRDANLDVFP